MIPRAVTDALRACGAEVEPATERLKTYVELLLAHNRVTDLIGPMDEARVWRELITDSLLPVSALGEAPPGPLLDLGSGAGLPGVPLACAFPSLPIHLIEPRQKRATFLKIATRKLGLSCVKVHEARMEDVPGLRGEAGTVAAKAFQMPPQLVETGAAWLRPGGLLFVYASRDSWSPEAVDSAARLGYTEIGRAPHPEHGERFGLVLRLETAQAP